MKATACALLPGMRVPSEALVARPKAMNSRRIWEAVRGGMPPEEVARRAQAEGACVTFTYSEPIVFLEYCIDTAIAAHKLGVRTTMVSGGSGEVEPACRPAASCSSPRRRSAG